MSASESGLGPVGHRCLLAAMSSAGHRRNVPLRSTQRLVRWEQEGPLSTQLPVSASVVRGYDIVVSGDVGIDCLMADLENAPDAAADRHSPAIVVISFPVGGDEGAGGQVPALGKIIIDEGLQGHGIYVRAVLVTCEGPEVEDQETSRYV